LHRGATLWKRFQSEGHIARMPANLSDVARMAGVSEATASRVMNGRRYVAPTTRTRVEAAARQLDYVPHRAARDLSMARTATVALLVHHVQYPAHGEGTFTGRVLDGAAQRLHRHGYDLLYLSVDDDAASRLRSLAAIHRRRTDGALLVGPAFPRDGIAALRAAGSPVVLVDNRLEGVDAVLADNRHGATLIARHLVDDHGYRRLACIAGPERWPSTAERVAATRRVAREAGATIRVAHARETTMRDGAEAVATLLDDPPEAIVAVNDAMALGAMHRLRRLPVRRRPAIVGFDDIAWAQLADPPLTTARVDTLAMGATAVELLLERIHAHGTNLPAREIRVPATLSLRRSCGCRRDPA
jgi:LacI family transcriptional regulator, galactose operon repressor